MQQKTSHKKKKCWQQNELPITMPRAKGTLHREVASRQDKRRVSQIRTMFHTNSKSLGHSRTYKM